jgi:predicted small metal-binding protein
MANPNKPDQPKGVQSAGEEKGSVGKPGGGENYTFRCSDMGFNDCPWQTQGASQEEVMRSAEQHGREQHRISNMDEGTRNRLRNNIHRAA